MRAPCCSLTRIPQAAPIERLGSGGGRWYTRRTFLWIPTSALLFVTIVSAFTTDDELLMTAALLGGLAGAWVWRMLGPELTRR